MSAELFNELPFNLAGELLDESVSAEGKELARIRSYYENDKRQQRFDLHDDTNENAL
jgi:hypothetical protein